MRTTSRRFGFTLIEMISVLTLLLIVAALAVPRFAAVVGQSRQSTVELAAKGVAKNLDAYAATVAVATVDLSPSQYAAVEADFSPDATVTDNGDGTLTVTQGSGANLRCAQVTLATELGAASQVAGLDPSQCPGGTQSPYVLLDDFNRSNAASLGTALTGQTWSTTNGSVWGTDNGTAYLASPGTNADDTWSDAVLANTGQADVDATVTITRGATDLWGGLVLRAAADGSTGLVVEMYSYGSTTELYVTDRTFTGYPGSFADLSGLEPGPGNSYDLRAVLSGNHLTVYVNTTVVFDRDFFPAELERIGTGTYAGMYLWYDAANDTRFSNLRIA